MLIVCATLNALVLRVSTEKNGNAISNRAFLFAMVTGTDCEFWKKSIICISFVQTRVAYQRTVVTVCAVISLYVGVRE